MYPISHWNLMPLNCKAAILIINVKFWTISLCDSLSVTVYMGGWGADECGCVHEKYDLFMALSITLYNQWMPHICKFKKWSHSYAISEEILAVSVLRLIGTQLMLDAVGNFFDNLSHSLNKLNVYSQSIPF